MSDDVEALRALSGAATPGPWSPDAHYVVGQMKGGRPGGEVIAQGTYTIGRWDDRQHRADAALIAAAVNYVRAALLAAAPAPTECNCGFGGVHDDANPRCARFDRDPADRGSEGSR